LTYSKPLPNCQRVYIVRVSLNQEQSTSQIDLRRLQTLNWYSIPMTATRIPFMMGTRSIPKTTNGNRYRGTSLTEAANTIERTHHYHPQKADFAPPPARKPLTNGKQNGGEATRRQPTYLLSPSHPHRTARAGPQRPVICPLITHTFTQPVSEPLHMTCTSARANYPKSRTTP
jgi:hypothetical protein